MNILKKIRRKKQPAKASKHRAPEYIIGDPGMTDTVKRGLENYQPFGSVNSPHVDENTARGLRH